MIPDNSLSTVVLYNPYLPPDDGTITDTMDVELGGPALYSGSGGLQYQTWTANIRGSGATTYIGLSAPNTPEVNFFSSSNLTWVRLAFDQNMYPVLCYIDQNGPAIRWYDATIPGYSIISLGSTVTNPCCTMDDKRDVATRLGTNDVIVAYIKSNNLYFRMQRDRYGTEYLLYSNAQTLIANPKVWEVGMDTKWRLNFTLTGQLYQ